MYSRHNDLKVKLVAKVTMIHLACQKSQLNWIVSIYFTYFSTVSSMVILIHILLNMKYSIKHINLLMHEYGYTYRHLFEHDFLVITLIYWYSSLLLKSL